MTKSQHSDEKPSPQITKQKKKPVAFEPAAHLRRSGLETRFNTVLGVLDEALHSDLMKERIWAVEQLLKIFFQEKKGNLFADVEDYDNVQALLDPAGLSDLELTHLIEQQLQEEMA